MKCTPTVHEATPYWSTIRKATVAFPHASEQLGDNNSGKVVGWEGMWVTQGRGRAEQGSNGAGSGWIQWQWSLPNKKNPS